MSDEPETIEKEEVRLAAEKAKVADAQAERDRLQKQAEENVTEMLKTWPGVRDEQAHKLSKVLAENKRLLKEKQYAEELNKKAKLRRDALDIEKLETRHLELMEFIDNQKRENKERNDVIKTPVDPAKEEEYLMRHKQTAEHHGELLERFKTLISSLGGADTMPEQHRADFKEYNEDILFWASQNYRGPQHTRNQPRPAVLIRYARTLMAAIVGNKGIPLMQKEAKQTREDIEIAKKKRESIAENQLKRRKADVGDNLFQEGKEGDSASGGGDDSSSSSSSSSGSSSSSSSSSDEESNNED